MMWRAKITQADVGFTADPFREGLGDTGLADPGLARDQNNAAVATLGLFPSAMEQVDLLIAANQWRHSRAHRFETALDSAHTQDLPCLYILGEALQGDAPEVAILE